MRFSVAVVVLACEIGAVAAAYAQSSPKPRPFALKNVVRAQVVPPTVEVEVSTSGTPLPAADLVKGDRWRLVYDTGDTTYAVHLAKAARWDATTKIATLVFPASEIAGLDVATLGWQAAYIGDAIFVATAAPPDSAAAFDAAKGKDDAALYLFGSWLAGRSTKPIYVIDAKVDLAHEWFRHGKTLGFLHYGGTFSTNTDATPPADKVRIDPDSITLFASVTRTVPVARRGLYGLKVEAPIAGEFTRADAVADWVVSPRATFVLDPVRNRFALDPFVSLEAGHAITKPKTIHDQPADLAGWNGIIRFVGGAVAEFYVFKANATKDDWYRFTIDASYVVRVPLLPEPFVEEGIVNGQRGAVVTVGTNARHEAQLAANWNISKYAGLALKYKYGALPPLFQLVDHQVTVGVTFLAAQK
jgi:hypothetical protein